MAVVSDYIFLPENSEKTYTVTVPKGRRILTATITMPDKIEIATTEWDGKIVINTMPIDSEDAHD